MALRGKARDWMREQGRANAALLLLAREMQAEFVAPADETSFAAVRGRAAGCAFELHVDIAPAAAGSVPVLVLSMRHFHAAHAVQLDEPGCVLPALDPVHVRAAIERACYSFATE
jgi:hypothetical protein